jgi:hypothetical protein
MLGGLCVAVAAAISVHLALVRLHYGVWAWTPGQRTPSISFEGRRYLRGGDYPALPAEVVRLADGPAGSGIYSVPPIPGAALTGLFVRYPDGHITGYALSGGP